MAENDALREGEKGAWLSISAYILLSVLKIGVGLWAASKALTADGVNNTTDIIVSLAVLIGLRISRKPPDRDHPYGHRRAETVAALIASFIMFAVGIQVIVEAGRSFFVPAEEVPNGVAAWVAIFSAAVMWMVYRYNRRLARKINSASLMAAAQDNRSDALVSIGAAVGIFGAQWGWGWLDPLAALIVGFIICKTAWNIFSDATHALTDGFDVRRLDEFHRTVKTTPGVKRLKDIRARVHGNNVLIDVVVEVSAELSVEQGHHISDHIENRMRQEHQIANVHVHIEPYAEDRENSQERL